MKYSITKNLFLNNCYAGEKKPVSEKMKKILRELEKTEEKIKKYLPEKDREKIMWDYSCLQGEVNCEIEESSFIERFKTGLLIGAEVFGELPADED